MAAVLPTLSARPNPQLWYTSSAGMPSSSVLARVRQRGHSGDDPQLAYFEWSAPDDADLDDVEAWAQANPALGIRVDLDAVRAERAAMSDEQFARERLGCGPTTAKATALDPDLWPTLIAPAPPSGVPTFALYVAPDHSTATIAGGLVRRPRVRGCSSPRMRRVSTGLRPRCASFWPSTAAGCWSSRPVRRRSCCRS